MLIVSMAACFAAGLSVVPARRPLQLSQTISSPTQNANAGSYGSAISGDGTRIAFYTNSTNLFTGSTNPSILVWDNTAQTFTLCSGGLAQLSRPSISRDGRYVVFYGATAVNRSYVPYVFDMSSDTGPTAAPVGSVLMGATWTTFPPSASNSVNGHYFVVFPELVHRTAGKTQLPLQILLWQIGTGTTSMISNSLGGAQASADCSMPVINSDATKVAYISSANNLIQNSAGIQEVFRTTLSGSIWTTDTAAFRGSTGTCSFPTIDLSGNVIAYQAQTSTKHIDVWVYTAAQNTSAIPYNTNTPYAGGGDQETTMPNLSPNGEAVAFLSWHLLAPASQEDLYLVNGVWTQEYVLCPSVYVQLLVSPYTVALETYHQDSQGGLHYRTGEYPCLANYPGNGDTLYDMAFDSGSDRILNDTSYPTCSWIYDRTQVAVTTP